MVRAQPEGRVQIVLFCIGSYVLETTNRTMGTLRYPIVVRFRVLENVLERIQNRTMEASAFWKTF